MIGSARVRPRAAARLMGSGASGLIAASMRAGAASTVPPRRVSANEGSFDDEIAGLGVGAFDQSMALEQGGGVLDHRHRTTEHGPVAFRIELAAGDVEVAEQSPAADQVGEPAL